MYQQDGNEDRAQLMGQEERTLQQTLLGRWARSLGLAVGLESEKGRRWRAFKD